MDGLWSKPEKVGQNHRYGAYMEVEVLSLAMVRVTHRGEAGSGKRDGPYHVWFVIIATNMEHTWKWRCWVWRWLGEQRVTHQGRKLWKRDREYGAIGAYMDVEVLQCNMGKLQWEVGNRNFSFLRERYIWNIWTRIKWEAKLTKVSEIFWCC